MLIMKFETSRTALDELRRLTDDPLEYAVAASDGSVLFAGPLPPEYGGEPFCMRAEDGGIIVDEIGFELLEDAWVEYEAGLPKTAGAPRRQYRTRNQIRAPDAIVDTPDRLALPSRESFEGVLSTIENPNGYLLPLVPFVLPDLHFENGKLYFQDMDATAADLVMFKDKTPEAVKKIDVPLLHALYTIQLQQTLERIATPEDLMAMLENYGRMNHAATIYVPSLLRMLGCKPNGGKDAEDIVFKKIRDLEDIYSAIEKRRASARTYYQYLPVMKVMGRNENENTISFVSPYINDVIMRILDDSLQRTKSGKPKKMRSGGPFLCPNHCYLVKSAIAKEQNKRAVEIVFVLAVLISRSGSGTPNIRIQKLVDRCPNLKAALDAAPDAKRKNTVLKRAFSKAWQLLDEQTIIRDAYKEVELPTLIPTTKKMQEVIYIRHKGRKQPAERQD